MRKLQVIYGSDEKKLMELVNDFFKKAQEVGYPIIATSYIKVQFGGHYAYIEYETHSNNKK